MAGRSRSAVGTNSLCFGGIGVAVGWSPVSRGTGGERDKRDSRDIGSTEAAARLGIDVRAVQRLAQAGELGEKRAGRWWFSGGELEDHAAPPDNDERGPIEAAMAATVAAMPPEVQSSPRARLVVVLARRMDATDAARDSAALSKELRSALDQLEDVAHRASPRPRSVVEGLRDDLARRRQQRDDAAPGGAA